MNHANHIQAALIAVGVIAILALVGVPVGAVAPYLLLLACPLSMVLMMKFMGHGRAQGSQHHVAQGSAPTDR